jgi:glycosyltransferase involved in cell wall biosynthesis
VIVPCHDDGPLAVEAVASVRAHPEPVELVVIDDGSTEPETAAALDRLRSEGVEVIRQENTGLGGARMTGVANTTAPYLFPLDSDDLLEPGSLTALADALDADAEAGFAWGDYVLFGDYEGRYRSPRAFLPWSLTYVNQYPVTSLIRRSALHEAGGWQMRAYEDWDLWLGFVERGIGGVRVDGIVYRRRLHGSSRLLAGARARHQQIYAELQARHPTVFAQRGELRRRESPGLLKRALYPIVFGRRAVVPFRLEAWLQRQMMRHGLRLSR